MSDPETSGGIAIVITILSMCCFFCIFFGILIYAISSAPAKSDKKTTDDSNKTKTTEKKTEIADADKIDSKFSSTKTVTRSANAGRYIKLKQNQVGCLNLGEIQVFSKEGGPNLITPSTVVTQSSDHSSKQYPSSNLVNNNLRDFMHTSCNDAAEVLIDLGDTYDINKIVLFNRPDCCWERAVGIVLSILDKDKNNIYTASPIKDKNGNITFKDDSTTTLDKTNYYSAFIYNPPDKAPKGVYWMGVAGNNGTVSCEKYCGGVGGKSWNDELPVEWKGAKCVDTVPNTTGCQNTFDIKKNPSQCICEATFTSWNK